LGRKARRSVLGVIVGSFLLERSGFIYAHPALSAKLLAHVFSFRRD
jgi:hypothetical protein